MSDKRILLDMTNAIVISGSTELAPPVPAELVARYAELSQRPQSDATAKAYAGDWKRFEAWCSGHGLASLPADEATIGTYIGSLTGKRYSTIARAYASIRAVHARGGHALGTLETVVNVLKSLARHIGTAPHGRAPLMAATLKKVTRAADDSMLAVRDNAMLLLGFAAAMRRSELVALDVSDVRFVDDGAEVTIRRSKTDQTGQGRTVAVAWGSKGSCPVRALRAWLEKAAIVEGPIFRGVDRGGHVEAERLSDKGVARAVKRAATAAGLDAREFGGHSLRAGLATSAAKAGKGLDVIMATTGHRSERIARGYIRHGALFDACANEGLL